MNNKVTYEKFDALLYATFGRPLDVQISLLSTRLQWAEKGRPMDVQYGTWTDRPNNDVLWTSLGRAMPIESWILIATHSQYNLCLWSGLWTLTHLMFNLFSIIICGIFFASQSTLSKPFIDIIYCHLFSLPSNHQRYNQPLLRPYV